MAAGANPLTRLRFRVRMPSMIPRQKDHSEDLALSSAFEEAARVGGRLRLLFPSAGFHVHVPGGDLPGAPVTLRVEWLDGPSERAVRLALSEPGIAGPRLPKEVLRLSVKREYHPDTAETVRKALLETGCDSGDEALSHALSGHDLPDGGESLRRKILSMSRRTGNIVSLCERRERKRRAE